MSISPLLCRKRKVWSRKKMSTVDSLPPKRPKTTTTTTTTSSSPSSPLSNKRSRSIDDVDGEDLIPQIKKRRLRLLFVTSRLSSPFSEPSTHILSHGTHKIASWIRRAIRAIRPPPPLVQIALLNNARMQAAMSLSEAQMLSREQLRQTIESRRSALQLSSIGKNPPPPNTETENAMHQTEQVTVPQTTVNNSLLSSTPFDSSTYLVFDDEAEATAGEHEEGWENSSSVSEIHSDFAVLRPIEAPIDDDIGPFPENILAARHD